MVLDHRGRLDTGEYRGKDIGGLFDDAGVGNDIDDALEPVHPGVVQREAEPGQGLAAAGGDAQAEQARRFAGTGQAGEADFPA